MFGLAAVGHRAINGHGTTLTVWIVAVDIAVKAASRMTGAVSTVAATRVITIGLTILVIIDLITAICLRWSCLASAVDTELAGQTIHGYRSPLSRWIKAVNVVSEAA